MPKSLATINLFLSVGLYFSYEQGALYASQDRVGNLVKAPCAFWSCLLYKKDFPPCYWTIGFFIFVFVFVVVLFHDCLLKQGLWVAQKLIRQGWSQTHRDPFASASWVPGFKACIIILDPCHIFKSTFLLGRFCSYLLSLLFFIPQTLSQCMSLTGV